ncbi:hypothetical protein [Streptomyces sp. NPDC005166]
MAFPLDIRTELLLNGMWTDISADVYVRDAKQITRGRRDQGSATDPARLSLTLNNAGGKYSPRNAMSPLYGQIGRNTQMRVSVPAATRYLSLVGDPNGYVSTPDTAALDITGDIDIRAEIQPNWYGPDNQMILGKWEPNGAQCSWFLKVYQGWLNFQHSLTGSPTNTWSYTRSLTEMPARGAVRVTLDADNGAGGRTVRWYTAPSIAGPWKQLGPDTVIAGTVALVNTTAPLKIGPTDLTTAKPARKPFIGRGFKFEVRSGIDGTVVANPDFTAQAAGATSFSDSAGRVWTLAGGAEIRDREDRFVGEVSSWPAKWTPDESDVYVPVEANGILRRLGQGLKALDSTLRRRIPSGDPIAYWPMEDGQYSTRAYSPTTGVDSAALSGVDWSSADDLPSSLPLPRLKASGALSAPVPVAASGEWQVEFVYNAYGKAPEFDQPHAEVIRFASPNGTVRNWVLGVHKGSAMWRVWGYNANGDDLVFHTFTPGDVLNSWVRLRFWAKDNGDGTFTFRIAWLDIGGETYGYSQTITGTCGRLNNIAATWGPGTEGWGIGHLSVLPVAGSTIYDYSDDAFLGDTAWNRIMRLGTEENVPVERIHGQDITSALVGPQRPETLIELMESAAEADGGILLESHSRVGLAFRDRASMYTQDPALTLSYTSAGLAPDLEPIDDDSAVRNDIVVQRDGGSAGRAYLADGPLSVQAPPLGIGVYDEQVTLSLGDDSQPEPMANWLLHLGTYDGARYPTVTVMLHKPGAEALIPQILALREGDMIRLTDLPQWLSADDVDLIIEGYSETLDLYRWEITFNCSPGGPWNVAQVENPAYYAKADTDGTVLRSAVGTADTSLVTQVTAGSPWTESPKETPFDITVAGERMRVDAVGALVTTDNPYFETGISGWSLENSTLAWSQAVVHPRGTGSLVITPNGTSAVAGAANTISAVGTVIPGKSVRVGMWVYSPVGLADVQPTIHFYNTAGTFISTGGLGMGYPVPAGQWTYLESVLAAPALATRGRMRPRIGSTPPAQPLYVWAPKAVTTDGLAFTDTFTRAAANGWGAADTGQAWTVNGGSAADYSVNGTVGLHVQGTKNVSRHTIAASPSADVDMVCDWMIDKSAITDSNYVFFGARYTDLTHMYLARVQVVTGTQLANLTIRKRNVAETQIGSTYNLGTYTPGTFYTLRFQVIGSQLSAKCWVRGTPEPGWQVTVTDTDLTAVGSVACRTLVGTNSTQTLPVTATFDNFQITNAQRFAVTRSANGVVKAHSAGEPVALARPAIASL